MKYFQTFSQNPETVNVSQMWKSMRRICPKFAENLTSAKKSHDGRIVTDPKALKSLLAKEYKERLRSRPIRPDFNESEKFRNIIFKITSTILEQELRGSC